MEYHEADLVGRLWVEEVAALPAWHVSFARRVLYRNTDGTFWFGNTNEWQRINTGAPEDYISAKKADVHAGTISPSADNVTNLGIAATNRYANVYSVNFIGTTTTATYADLAEKYTAEYEFPPGAVLQLSKQPNFDLELCGLTGPYIGVVSENPGFVMNSECEGQPIALIGKVPVQVIGEIKKSQAIMPADFGVAVGVPSLSPDFEKYKIGYSLETNLSKGKKLVTCILR